jgi:hypothetical protein
MTRVCLWPKLKLEEEESIRKAIHHEAWRLEDVFVSFEHLPMSKELQLQKIVFRKSRRAVILETEASAH